MRVNSRARRTSAAASLAVHTVLITSTIVFVFPLLWMVSTSLKTLPQVLQYPPSLIPAPADWTNYPQAVSRLPFGLYLRNTLVIAIGSTLGSVLSCSIVAYAFAKLRFPGKNVLFLFVLGTLMLPDIVRLVPTFVLFKQFGWINTFYPLIVPSFFGNAFFIFLLRQFFLGIPKDLIDAGRIDGASEWGILWRIVLPLSGPALTVVAIFAFQMAWNDFVWPLVFLTDTKMKTLTLGLYLFRNLPQFGTPYHEMMAAATVITLPMIILFAVFQRYFLQGIAVGGSGIKG